MKNFDEELWEERESDEARAFVIRGETFYRKKAIRLETLFQAETIDTDESDGGDQAAAEILDRQILRFIEDRDGAHDRYRALREREDDGLGYRHIQDLKRWLIEEETGLPTTAPSASPNGRASSTERSTARSSSPAAKV